MKNYGINSNTSIFDINRPPKSVVASHSVPDIELRQLKEKIMMMYRDLITGQENSYIRNELDYTAGKNNSTLFWMQMNSALAYCYNNPFNNEKRVELKNEISYLTWVIDDDFEILHEHFEDHFISPIGKVVDDAVYFYLKSNNNDFCNFIVLSLRQKIISKILNRERGNQLVRVINGFFRSYNHNFELTPFVYDYENWDYEYQVPTVLEYPRVISKADSSIYENAIEPALSVLREPPFHQANTEFLGALEDFRNEDFSDCLTKCGSAFESVLKILSNRLGIQFSNSEPSVGERIKCVVKYLKLDDYFIHTLKATPVIRNKLSSAHGRGEDVKIPSSHVTQYVVDCTASAILLLINESNR